MRLAAAGICLVGLLASAAPVFAENPCDESTPSDLSDVVGYTWTGTIDSIDYVGAFPASLHIRVDHVYANGVSGKRPSNGLVAGHRVLVVNDGCASIFGLTAASRYLFSTSRIYPSQTRLTTFTRPQFAAWELHGTKAALIESGGPFRPLPEVFAQPHTLAAVVALLTGELPPTDAAAPSNPLPVGGAVWPMAILLGAVAGIAFLLKPACYRGD